jgi:hypothetical protein
MRRASMAWQMVLFTLCARVVEVLALEEDLRAAHLAAHARGVVDRAGPAHEVRELAPEFGQELGVVPVLLVGRLQFVDGVRERLAHETAAVDAEVAAVVGLLVGGLHGRESCSVDGPRDP